MKFCNNCKVNIRGQNKYCPLCQSELDAENETENIFPNIPTIFHKHNYFIRVMILISVAVSVICAAINILFPTDIWWSLFVAVGIACFWVSISVAILKRRNLPKNILYQVIILSSISFLWDLLIGWQGWSLDYVIPIICTLAMAAMAIIAKVANLQAADYLIYMLIDVVLGIIPLILVFLNVVNMRIPSLICTVSSIISLTALILFEGENMFSEIKRRFRV
jgi:hypothetical protein